MSFLKKSKIWLGWFGERHTFLSTIFCLIGFVAALISFLFITDLITGLMEPVPFSLNPVAGVVIIIVGSILSLLAFTAINNASSDNWRVAIMRALTFGEEHELMNEPIFLNVVRCTERKKDPTELNEWIDNWEKLSSTKAYLQGLEKEKEEIEKEIPLKKVNAKIGAEKERIKELESELV